MAFANDTQTKTVEQLNSFLRGEISAVETYRIALDKIDAGHPAKAVLQECMGSHAHRVTMLRQAVSQLGGKPSDGSGAWGALTKAIEGGAAAFGSGTAIAALEEGEDHGLKDYRTDLSKLPADVAALVTQELLPRQERTHEAISRLKNAQSAYGSSASM